MSHEKVREGADGTQPMNVGTIVHELNIKYPGKTVILNDPGHPTEILCELEPTSAHPEYSLAISVMTKGTPHSHVVSTETYTVVRGALKLHVGNEIIELLEGQSQVLPPGIKHWGEGNETWIECLTTPGWTLEDHVLARA